MSEFFVAIHRDLTSKNPHPSPEQMKEATKQYQDCIAGIAAVNKLVAPPKRWDVDGRVVRAANKVQEGPLCRRNHLHWRVIPDKGKRL